MFFSFYWCGDMRVCGGRRLEVRGQFPVLFLKLFSLFVFQTGSVTGLGLISSLRPVSPRELLWPASQRWDYRCTHHGWLFVMRVLGMKFRFSLPVDQGLY